MDRFGSSKLRIGWVLVCLFVTGLVLMAVQSGPKDAAAQILLFGTAIPLGPDSLRSYVILNIRETMYWVVSLVILLGAFGPVSQWTAAAARGERFKGFFAGTGLGFAHGLFLSQVALVPVWALSWRLIGQAWPMSRQLRAHTGTRATWERNSPWAKPSPVPAKKPLNRSPRAAAAVHWLTGPKAPSRITRDTTQYIVSRMFKMT